MFDTVQNSLHEGGHHLIFNARQTGRIYFKWLSAKGRQMSAVKQECSPAPAQSHETSHAATSFVPHSDFASTAELALAQLIVDTLNLAVAAEAIVATAPLYGEPLGLDSIDILELALVISKTYHFQLRSDDENNLKIFSSLRSLNEHIQQHRAA
jgi:acyl carrier protein